MHTGGAVAVHQFYHVDSYSFLAGGSMVSLIAAPLIIFLHDLPVPSPITYRLHNGQGQILIRAVNEE